MRFGDFNVNGLLENWPKYSSKLKNVLDSSDKSSDFATMWSEDIEQVLILLKLLPLVQTGRNTAPKRANFQEATKKLIIFSKV